MADNFENLLLEHLKRFEATLERVECRLDEMFTSVSNLEHAVAAVVKQVGGLAAANAAQQLAIDNVGRRLDRIERRLELTS